MPRLKGEEGLPHRCQTSLQTRSAEIEGKTGNLMAAPHHRPQGGIPYDQQESETGGHHEAQDRPSIALVNTAYPLSSRTRR